MDSIPVIIKIDLNFNPEEKKTVKEASNFSGKEPPEFIKNFLESDDDLLNKYDMGTLKFLDLTH